MQAICTGISWGRRQVSWCSIPLRLRVLSQMPAVNVYDGFDPMRRPNDPNETRAAPVPLT